jgi:hypothetical protein
MSLDDEGDYDEEFIFIGSHKLRIYLELKIYERNIENILLSILFSQFSYFL